MWQKIAEFPDYSVNEFGEVRNDRFEHVLSQQMTPRGVLIGLCRDRVQYKRMLARIVAETFLPEPELPAHRQTFTTPINLDGDRTNNYASNLMWRPRWFAIKYHQQFQQTWRKGCKIYNPGTGETFENVLEACMVYGLLAFDVFREAMNHGYYKWKDHGVWPSGQHFEIIDYNSSGNRRL